MMREVSSAAAYTASGFGHLRLFDRRRKHESDRTAPPQPRILPHPRIPAHRVIPHSTVLPAHPPSSGPPFITSPASWPPSDEIPESFDASNSPSLPRLSRSPPTPHYRTEMSGHSNQGYNAVPSPSVHRYRVKSPDTRYLDGSPLQTLPENPFNRNSYHDPGHYPTLSSSPGRPYPPEFDDIDPSSIADEEDPTDYHEESRQSTSWKRPAAGAVPYSQVGSGGSTHVLNASGVPLNEKSTSRHMGEFDKGKRKRNMWIFIIIVAILLAAGVVIGAVLATRNNGTANPPPTTSNNTSSDSNLTASSPQIKQLMNNTDLHKVFPVMDYTPSDTQYPGCLQDPPDQNNITMDVAVLSQLTPAIRLYGTDCDQTEMTLTAIDRLGMNDTMKVWLGVWISNNQTTNDRQLEQMYDILSKYPTSHFLGVIVGNEVLFRKDQTEDQLISILKDVRSNFTSLGYPLSVSTSDLGSSWNASLAAASDHIMGNIHPFFAGVTADSASSWTWSFWQNNDVAIDSSPVPGSTVPRNIISETGWPSGGGNDCGTGVTCSSSTAGSVAGIDEINKFMEGWVCDANANGTMYFWFEAFDEPWKVIYNTPGENWEDKWGLMTVDRQLKDGLVIPDCGGKTF